MTPTNAQTSGGAESSITRPSPTGLMLLMSVVLYGIAIRPGTMSVVAVVVATATLLISISRSRRTPDLGYEDAIDQRLLVAVGLFGLLGVIGWSPSLIGPTSAALERIPGAIWIGLAALMLARRGRATKRGLRLVVIVTVVTVGVFGALHIESTGDVGFDVYHLHIAAAEALGDGQNPYTDAVSVPNGSPNAEPGDVIVGYPYPPITAVGYALGHWLTPDARYTGLIAWLVVLALIGVAGARRISTRHVAVMLLAASVPGLWLVLRAAWTEPLSLMFATVATMTWFRSAMSGVGLGAMLGSKQYFLVTAPALILHRDKGWQERVLSAGIVVVVSIGLALIWDFGAFWDSAIAFHTSTEPRSDSANLIGLLSLAGVDWAPPTFLPLATGIAAGAWAAWRSSTRRTFLLATSAALASSFLVTSQAFANYWLMVFGLVALALLPAEPAGDTAAMEDRA